MFGEASLACGSFDRERDFDGFKVHPNMRSKCPALSLFDGEAQRDELVFRTREPVMTAEEVRAGEERSDIAL